jgi:multidrug efflux pump
MISDFCIKRPVFAAVLSMLLIVLGLASLLRLSVRELPDVDSAVVTVSTAYTGAAPEIVDTDITEVIESAVAGVAGVKTIRSNSRRGRGWTAIESSSRDATSTRRPTTCATPWRGCGSNCRTRSTSHRSPRATTTTIR